MPASAPLDAAACAAAFSPFGGVLKIVVTDDGSEFWIDGTSHTPVAVLEAPARSERACFWRCSLETLRRICAGGRAIESAFVSRRLEISGNFAVMARLELKDHRS